MKSKTAGKISQIHKFLKQDLWSPELASLSKARRAGLKFLRVCALVIKGFKEDDCPTHASALTFHFVMALVPTLVIAFSFAKGFGMETLHKSVIEMLDPPAIEQSATGQAPSADAVTLSGEEEATEPAVGEENPISGYLTNTVRQMPDALKQGLVKIMETVAAASAGAMGGIGAVLFLYIMLKMLNQIEETFNSVWGVQSSRSTIDKVRNYVFIMAVTPLFLILDTAAGPTLIAVSSKLEWVLGPASQLLALVVPALMISLGFSIFYIFLPNTRVHFSAAFTGALISALLVVILQQAMIKLGFGVSKYNKIYGALAAIPIFLFWVQMSWMILLMGAEVAFSVQNAGTYSRERIAVNPSARSRLCLAFALMKKITDAFYY